MKTSIKIFILGNLLSIIFTACTEKPNEDRSVTSGVSEIEKGENDKEKQKHIEDIFHSLPSPLELTNLFKKEGIRYNKELMHTTKDRKEYHTSIKKALNLGIYGADLSFSGLHGKHQSAIEYFSSCQKLAADLGISSAFQNKFISRLEDNARDRDTLLSVINDFFSMRDSDLKGENHQDISTYVLTGGWIEGMYLGTSMTSVSTDLNGMRKLVLDQKKSLHNLIYLLQSVKQNAQSVKLINDIGQLEVLYRDYLESSENGNLSEEQFLKIKDKVSSLRAGIIAF